MYYLIENNNVVYSGLRPLTWNDSIPAWEISPGTAIGDPRRIMKHMTSELSVADFKLRFTSQERIYLETLKNSDNVVKDLFLLLDDPRTLKVDVDNQQVQEGIDYCIGLCASNFSYSPEQRTARYNAITERRDITDA